jgi:hypothetical protein
LGVHEPFSAKVEQANRRSPVSRNPSKLHVSQEDAHPPWEYPCKDLKPKLQFATFHLGPARGNKIEHRVFCHITQNRRGRALASLDTIVNLIADTRTTKGLKIHSALDQNSYEKGIKFRMKKWHNSESPKTNFMENGTIASNLEEIPHKVFLL